MKVVLVGNTGPDYLQDVVYHGLATLLGPQNVVDWPRNPRYHEKPPEDARFPQLHFALAEPARASTLAEELRDADALILGSTRDGAYDHVKAAMALPKRPPTAYLDGEDDCYVREIVRDVDAYFKRETLTARPPMLTPLALQRLYFRFGGATILSGPMRRPIAIARAGRGLVRPLPFGMIDPGFRPERRERYDVAFMGFPSHATRASVTAQLRELEKQGIRVFVPTERLPWRDYLQVLADSRVCISLRGGGWDTYRYWEIPFVGSTLLSEPPQIEIVHNFVEGKEAFFAPPGEMLSSLPALLATDTRAVADAGRAKLLAHHMSTHRAATVLEALGLTA